MQFFQGFVCLRWLGIRAVFPSVAMSCLTLAAATLTMSPTATRAAGSQEETNKAFLVVDDKTGHILAEQKANDKLQVASLTKIATAIVTLDWARVGSHGLEQTVTISPAALSAGGSTSVGFEAGDEVTVRDLLYAALLQSDNVAAEALAMHAGRDFASPAEASSKTAVTPEVNFIAQMNALARHLGMERTRFYNPTGADSKERPYSTAADLARLTRHALGKADFRFFVAQKERRISVTRAGAPTEFVLHNTNELLGVNNVDGVKTGQTTRAGSCLIITAARESIVKQEGTSTLVTPRRLIVVLLGSADRFGDAARLLDRGIIAYDKWAEAGRPLDPKQNL